MTEPTDIWDFHKLVDEIERLLDEIERRLDDAGEPAWAQRLRDAVLGDSMSGEILDRVGVELRSLAATGVPDRAGVASDVRTASQFVAGALGPQA